MKIIHFRIRIQSEVKVRGLETVYFLATERSEQSALEGKGRALASLKSEANP